jgi:hypothetical protein
MESALRMLKLIAAFSLIAQAAAVAALFWRRPAR